jgi:hypothetical protein
MLDTSSASRMQSARSPRIAKTFELNTMNGEFAIASTAAIHDALIVGVTSAEALLGRIDGNPPNGFAVLYVIGLRMHEATLVQRCEAVIRDSIR